MPTLSSQCPIVLLVKIFCRKSKALRTGEGETVGSGDSETKAEETRWAVAGPSSGGEVPLL